MDVGSFAYALSVKNNADLDAAAARGAAQGAIQGLAQAHREYVFAAKSHVHGLRALVHGHQVTEDRLIAALKAENANHPMASREVVDAAVWDAASRALVDPEVIKKTYPDGKLPEGAVIPPDGTQKIA